MASEDQPASSPTAAAQPGTSQTADFEAIKNFIETIKTLSSDASFKGASAVVEQTTKLQKQVESKDEEIVASLESSVQEKENALTEQKKTIDDLKSQLQNLEKSYEEEKAKVTQSHKDIDELQKKLKERNEFIEKMKKAGSAIKQKLTAAETKVTELETANSSLQEQLQAKSEKLHELEGFAAEYNEEEEDSLVEKFFNLWGSASKAVIQYLAEDLSTEALQVTFSHQVPLPQSNSDAAKQMRIAVISAILAREIDKHIFQPSYILPEDSGIRELLADLAMKNSKKESFCRALLLSIDPDTQAKNLEKRMKQVVTNVGSYLDGLLSETQYTAFCRSLEEVVKDAADLWKTIQHSRAKYEPDFDPLEWGDTELDPFPYAEASTASDQDMNGGGNNDENLLFVFPRLCQVQNNERNPCNFATSLRRWQCLAAERELKKREPSSPTIGRVASGRRRSRGMSLSLNSPNGQNGHFLGKASPSGVNSGG
ncbi:hypothetical protein T310_4377 [Rasamsonia emersonii CBS 393.64]|uniref:MEI5 protein n=1 Tax=Rasamsonia emersonii (strain ATCC 16479 / CBS 393.64 / IMI 116815) TaxID=1408163 RepID=A0A0F4YTZ3_RASE3|nr:hypothetical protein T310_4377 [Rasamsonia emersonii CBS 393.64]KKA21590.1 hypothetical protein T310_4377 [Rasamsonia emersonii CBS 393.64]